MVLFSYMLNQFVPHNISDCQHDFLLLFWILLRHLSGAFFHTKNLTGLLGSSTTTT